MSENWKTRMQRDRSAQARKLMIVETAGVVCSLKEGLCDRRRVGVVSVEHTVRETKSGP